MLELFVCKSALYAQCKRRAQGIHSYTGAVRAVFSVKNVDPFIECIEISIDYIKLIE